MSYTAYKFRIYPTAEQEVFFAKTFGCVRFVYNHYLDKKIKMYQEDKSSMTYNQCSRDLTLLKQTEEYNFLAEVDSIALIETLRHLDTAYQNFFKRPEMGFPRFKSKKNNHQSYTTRSSSGAIFIKDGYIKLPKVGFVKIHQHRVIPADYVLKSATISQTPDGKYYASLTFMYDNQVQRIEPQAFLGLCFSISELYVDSEGNHPGYPHYYYQAEEKLQREQRKLSKMKKDSKNREKQRIKLAKLHTKIANQRKDFLHKQARQIANAYDCICIPDLKMKDVIQTLDAGKEVGDAGWQMFITLLKYKLESQGKQLVLVELPSVCNNCGYENSEIKNLQTSIWDCPQCGAHHNIAVDIKNAGIQAISS